MASANTLPLAIDRAYRNGFFTVQDPGASGTLSFANKGAVIVEVVTAAAESRALPTASGYGVGTRLEVVFKTDGGDLTITGAESDAVLRSAGEVVEFVIGLSGSTKVWRQVASSSLLVDADIQAAARGVEVQTQTALTDTATVTAAQLLTKILDSTATANATYTLPTAALLVAAIPGAKVGDSFQFTVNAKAATHTITVEAGTGGTGDGTLTVASGVARSFLLSLTNVTASSEAYLVYGLGT